MRCPICKRETVWRGNPHRPFCSERCRWIDLDNWLSGRYRMPAPLEQTDREEEDQPAERAEDGRG